MESLVLDLQKAAYSSQGSISELVRKAYFVAKKLKLTEFEKWLSQELDGYSDVTLLPEYRYIKCVLKGYNPYHGWQDVIFPDVQLGEKISRQPVVGSIRELEEQSTQNYLAIQLPGNLVMDFGKATGAKIDYKLFLQPTQIIKILDKVRKIILDWAIELEAQEIIGSGLTFTDEEQKNASRIGTQIIYNFNGSINQSQIQQNSSNSTQNLSIEQMDNAIKLLLDEIRNNKDDIVINNQEDILNMEEQLNILEEHLRLRSQNQSLIQGAVIKLKVIFEKATENIVTQAIIGIITNKVLPFLNG